MVEPRETYETLDAYYLALTREIARNESTVRNYTARYQIKNLGVGEQINALSRVEQRDLLVFMFRWCSENKDSEQPNYRQGTHPVYEVSLNVWKRKLTFDRDSLVDLLRSYCVYGSFYSGGSQIVKTVTNYLAENELTPDVEQAIATVWKCLGDRYYLDAKCRQQIAQLTKLLPGMALRLPIVAGECWSDQAIADLKALPGEAYAAWSALLEICTVTTASKPSAKWLKQATAELDKLDHAATIDRLTAWFPLVDKPRTQPIEHNSGWADPNLMVNDKNADLLKGLVWLCPTLVARVAGKEGKDVSALVRSLAALAQSAYRKVPQIGPRCVRVGNACVWALGEIPGMDAIGQLALLKVKVKFGTAQKGIEKALTAAAEREGLPREEIDELAVPVYGMESLGLRREILGEFTAELEVTGTSSTVLRWIKPDGKAQKSIPKAVKDNFSEELNELKQAAKDIKKMMPAQRDRIELLYLQQKTWNFVTWRDRYLDHPLVGTLARRLIWWFTTSEDDAEVAGIWLGDRLVDIHSKPLDIDESSEHGEHIQVRLWHPLESSSATVLAWRNWLVEHEIQQPFKQAHREIYLLTAAEETTHTYSNRFAAHILKQHQFHALCAQRGWRNTLRLMVDDYFDPASIDLPHWGLRAEFWIDGIGDDYGVDTNETGTFLYLATDQVRFYPIDAGINRAYAGSGGYGDRFNRDNEPIALEEIPVLVLSEVMRDVDLFVGVASVGNDPNWSDGGPEGRFLDYWTSYSFGELSGTATTRRQLLEALVPKLKIRDRCSFTDRFLVVRGEIRTYKIHLGSGNILMEPNDQYLCIVPDRKPASGSLFLPFEGDNMLSIILSKAFLLADDTQITDPTITHQLQPR